MDGKPQITPIHSVPEAQDSLRRAIGVVVRDCAIQVAEDGIDCRGLFDYLEKLRKLGRIFGLGVRYSPLGLGQLQLSVQDLRL